MSVRCGYCGSNLHPESHCPKTWGGSVAHAQLRCSYCGAGNHDFQACPKRHTGPADWEKGVTLLDKGPR